MAIDTLGEPSESGVPDRRGVMVSVISKLVAMGILQAECDLDFARPGPRRFRAAQEDLSAEVDASMNEAGLRRVIWKD
jgi:hypothetical protein